MPPKRWLFPNEQSDQVPRKRPPVPATPYDKECLDQNTFLNVYYLYRQACYQLRVQLDSRQTDVIYELLKIASTVDRAPESVLASRISLVQYADDITDITGAEFRSKMKPVWLQMLNCQWNEEFDCVSRQLCQIRLTDHVENSISKYFNSVMIQFGIKVTTELPLNGMRESNAWMQYRARSFLARMEAEGRRIRKGFVQYSMNLLQSIYPTEMEEGPTTRRAAALKIVAERTGIKIPSDLLCVIADYAVKRCNDVAKARMYLACAEKRILRKKCHVQILQLPKETLDDVTQEDDDDDDDLWRFHGVDD